MPPGAVGNAGDEGYVPAGADPGAGTAGDPGVPDADESGLAYPDGGAWLGAG
ncbi:MAG: hypothetical protein ACLP9L_02945 [Thermoguttaceae bacterium]